ncbi:hypothetical protein MOQ67_31120 (plasmid) [Pseudomonas sp. LY-1]|jgi:hypothetical protein|uniref:Uncharacterized protein n=5 Tax=Pseudomonadaceae TaxID=135621 RepID=A0A220ITG3_PSEFL|nr:MULTISPECIES: hypothetical protein [Pseudomonas]OHC62146.1 MAG: hypothetical protein A3J25_03740 [Pseudomonadales bacterium RIFCSPLOWO2_02_FULL_63_210]HDS0958831.1 hypothetical protein [Pseudomonas putida]ASI38145.1 Hypothetical protein [Pseudomonas fluorescens]EIU2646747.1 hypothetical protein [Pseudomonas aeruginosa]EIU2686624.1 hypothetical protein [Pseudomonas aeruginosa]
MQSPSFKSSYLPEYLAWLMFLAGVANATLIWSGVFAAAPQAFLLLFGGLFGTAGIALLGLLMLATWCALGLLLAALTRRALECRS